MWGSTFVPLFHRFSRNARTAFTFAIDVLSICVRALQLFLQPIAVKQLYYMPQLTGLSFSYKFIYRPSTLHHMFMTTTQTRSWVVKCLLNMCASAAIVNKVMSFLDVKFQTLVSNIFIVTSE
jgi:hypothetical protein